MRKKTGHPIRVVARRTGLTPEVIRAWERRYSLVKPKRSQTGRRLYSDEDIEKLRLVRRATLSGRRVGDVSHLSMEALEALTREDEREIQGVPDAQMPDVDPNLQRAPRTHPADADAQTAAVFVEACMEAVRDLDHSRLAMNLNRGLLNLGAIGFIDRILGPLLREIGASWKEGRLDPYNEHLATGAVRQVCSQVFVRGNPDPTAPVVVVTTPAGQRHEIGALFAACAAHTVGCNVVYLGADLPARDIARAAAQVNADVVALSIVYPPDDPGLPAELSELHRRLRPGVAVIAGGAAAPSYARVIRRIAAELIPEMAGFQSRLAGIRAAKSTGRGSEG
jgi:MerR family transcriptional regulator, light-induced transcriptional regulator